MKKVLAVVISCMFVGLIGCASKGKVATNGATVNVIETVPKGSQPSWTNDGKEYFEKDGKMYYVTVAEGFANLEASKRASFAAAQTRVAEQIKNNIGVEFGRSLEAGSYEETTGGYLKDVFMSNVQKLQVSGIIAESTYSEKLQEVNGYDSKVYWRTYTLASIPVSTYKNLVSRAFSDTSKQVAQNKSAKELLKEAESRFYEKD
ncbi:hypothetical protein [Candidatus Ruminimicrobium bovinum]|uniref:hypothetical protein n=1 Tax=Candidatus Ruminimicrobium bovinum TaxID=3242779 RepID=UPI0039B99EFC